MNCLRRREITKEEGLDYIRHAYSQNAPLSKILEYLHDVKHVNISVIMGWVREIREERRAYIYTKLKDVNHNE